MIDLTCQGEGCAATIVWSGRGRRSKWCRDCAKKAKKAASDAHYARNREEIIAREQRKYRTRRRVISAQRKAERDEAARLLRRREASSEAQIASAEVSKIHEHIRKAQQAADRARAVVGSRAELATLQSGLDRCEADYLALAQAERGA